MGESLSKMERLIKEFKRKYRVNGVKILISIVRSCSP